VDGPRQVRRPSLNPIPPRMTWKSSSPRGSDRTMVGNKTALVLFSFRRQYRVVMNDSKRPPCRVQISSQRKWGWLPRCILSGGPSVGEMFLLTSPFIEPPTLMPNNPVGGGGGVGRGGSGRGRGRAPEFPGGQTTESGFLRAALKWLGEGYREVSAGRYVSADGLRQVRFGAHEVRALGPGLP
jgi:hypothetical protein